MSRNLILTILALSPMILASCGARYPGIISDNYASEVTSPPQSKPVGTLAQVSLEPAPGLDSSGGTRVGALALGIFPILSILSPNVVNDASTPGSLTEMPLKPHEIDSLLIADLTKAKLFSSVSQGKNGGGYSITGHYRFSESMRAHGSLFGILYWIGVVPPLLGLPARTEGVSIDLDMIVLKPSGEKTLEKTYHAEDSWQYGLYYGENINAIYGQKLLPHAIASFISDCRNLP